MSLLADSDSDIRCLHIGVSESSEADLVRPEHKVAPVGLMVFEELTIELKILSDLDSDVLGVNGCVPLARAKGEGTHSTCNIIDGTLFSMKVFNLNVSLSCVLIAG